MVFEEVEIGARGAKALVARTYSLVALQLDFDEDDGTSNRKKRMKDQREGHHLDKVGLKVKHLLVPVCVTNVLLEAPPNS